MPSSNEVTYMSHNHRLYVYGKCNCVCHQGKTICNCGWKIIFGEPTELRRIKLRSSSTKRTTVRAFSNTRHVHPPMQVASAHTTHQLIGNQS